MACGGGVGRWFKGKLMPKVLFEGRNFEQSNVERVWRKGSILYCRYNKVPIILRIYLNVKLARLGKKYLEFKLKRRRRWI